MAKKMKKLPRAPKLSASNETKIGYLKKVKAVQAENRKILIEKKKGEALSKKIAAVKSKRV